MSVSVINPMSSVPSFYKLKSRAAVKRIRPSPACIIKIKRDLFGPVDEEANKRFVARELAKYQREASEKWGFDFIEGHPLDKHPQYVWMPTFQPPSVYTLTNAAHLLDTTSRDGFELDDSYYRPQPSCDNPVPNTSGVAAESSSEEESGLLSPEPECRFVFQLRPRKSAPAAPTSVAREPTPKKRQPKITDYLKERKKPSVTSPAGKKMPAPVSSPSTRASLRASSSAPGHSRH